MADVPLMNNPMTTAGDVIYGGASGAPTRLAVGTAGQVLKVNAGATAPEWGAASGVTIELDYVEFTSNVNPTATTEATANTVVTAGAESFDGSTIALIEFFSPIARPDNTATGRTLQLWLYDGSSSIGMLGQMTTPAAQADHKQLFLTRRLTPSNASHTYSVRASVSAGTGLVGGGAGGNGNTMPGYIRICKVI